MNDSLLSSFHSEPAHHSKRCDILWLGASFHRSQIKDFESGSRCGQYCFFRVALTVVILANPVAEVASVRASGDASHTNVPDSCLIGTALCQEVNRFSRGDCTYCFKNLPRNEFFARRRPRGLLPDFDLDHAARAGDAVFLARGNVDCRSCATHRLAGRNSLT